MLTLPHFEKLVLLRNPGHALTPKYLYGLQYVLSEVWRQRPRPFNKRREEKEYGD